jgi:hypothetical protein
MRRKAFILLALALAPGPMAMAQAPAFGPNNDPMAARLSADKAADVETGSYVAGEEINFTLDRLGDKYLLRFAGNPETFVLSVDRVVLGGRVLKYDTGTTALRISVWGGMTLYTDQAPGGLPATRTGDVTAADRAPVGAADLENALRDETGHLAYADQVALRFSAGGIGDKNREDAFDTLINAGAAIERVLALPAGRNAFQRRIQTVRLTPGDRPGLSLSGRTLVIAFVPGQGPLGRLSSRAMTVELGKILSVPESG